MLEVVAGTNSELDLAAIIGSRERFWTVFGEPWGVAEVHADARTRPSRPGRHAADDVVGSRVDEALVSSSSCGSRPTPVALRSNHE